MKIKVKKELEYKPLIPINTTDWSRRDGVEGKNYEHMMRLNRLAKLEGSILGRILQFPAMDAHGFYQVVAIDGVYAFLNWCEGVGYEGYESATLGRYGVMFLQQVKESIAWNDALKTIRI
jgi:hypothetical protein